MGRRRAPAVDGRFAVSAMARASPSTTSASPGFLPLHSERPYRRSPARSKGAPWARIWTWLYSVSMEACRTCSRVASGKTVSISFTTSNRSSSVSLIFTHGSMARRRDVRCPLTGTGANPWGEAEIKRMRGGRFHSTGRGLPRRISRVRVMGILDCRNRGDPDPGKAFGAMAASKGRSASSKADMERRRWTNRPFLARALLSSPRR